MKFKLDSINKTALFGIGTSAASCGLKLLDCQDFKMKVLGVALIAIGAGISIYCIEKAIEQGVTKAIKKAYDE
jgi:hypothetical protein